MNDEQLQQQIKIQTAILFLARKIWGPGNYQVGSKTLMGWSGEHWYKICELNIDGLAHVIEIYEMIVHVKTTF